jgi:serine/threonine-protein kinase
VSILEIGKQIGHYEIVAPLGSGGMAEVYRARDMRLGRMVAIKVMAASIQYDRDHVSRFRLEASTLSALNHPNIVTVFDVDQVGPMVYIVMELVQGRSLRALLQAGALPLPMMMRLAVQIARGLEKAHEARIVHRDLKPENLMVTDDGLVKILDFGLAKVAASTTDETQTPATQPGAVVGTTTYMAPEQMRSGTADFRSDQFAFGLILFEMATGQHPFRRETWLGTVAAIIGDQLQSMVGLNPNVPPPLVWLIERCLSKNPAQRYSSTRELVGQLQAIEQGLASPGTTSVRQPTTRPRGGRAVIDSIAILPFDTSGGAPDLEYLSDGLTEGIISSLSQTRTVRVMARSTVFRYKGSTSTPQQIGAELAVVAVLTGRVTVLTEKVTVRAELVSVADGSRLWGGHYMRPWSDVMAIERELSTQIAEALRVRLTAAQRRRLERRATANTDAYQMYLRGRFLLNKRTLDAIRKAIEQFQLAIDRDPQFARAYAGLADCHIVMGTGGFGVVPSREALMRAQAAAAKAIELDDDLAEAHRSLGQIHLTYTWNWDAAERELQRALRLDPGDAMTHSWFSEVCTVRERFTEGLAAARRGIELDPLSINASFYLMRVAYYARRYNDVVEEGRKVLELEPTFYRTNLMLAPAYQMLGRGAEAIALVDRLIAIVGSNPFLACLRADLLARNGARDAALVILEEVTELSRTRYVDPYDFARIHIALGDADRAFEWLERAFEARSAWLIWLKVSPFSDGLRHDPRFADLVGRIGVTT